MTIKTVIFILLIFALPLSTLFVYYYYVPHHGANFGRGTKYLLVRKGETPEKVAANLDTMGAVSSKSDFLFFARLLGKSDRLKVGRFAIKPGSSLSTILGTIVRGESSPFNVTIPEGFTIAQITSLLESTVEMDLEKFETLVSDKRYLDSLQIPGDNLEGYMAPSTYNLYYDESPRKIINKMVAHFYESLPDSFTIKAHRLGLTTHQAVTLASLVEKEARLSGERPIIAAVLLNRLRKGMRLDCDPTVIYALGGLNRPLMRADLDFESPYNTYRNYGLPPGPIANPGVKALEAAVNPAPVGYLYFVARGDGSHAFSFSLDDHINATNRIKRQNNHD